MESDGQQATKDSSDPLALFAPFPEILGFTFASLSVPDLLKCSQVSILWRETVAPILAQKDCWAYVVRNCKDIFRLNGLLESTESCWINAMNVNVARHHSSCFHYLDKNDRFSFTANIRKLPLRALSLFVSSCDSTQQLVQEILVGAATTLEELTLSYDHESRGYIVLEDTKLVFPKLKAINITKPFNWVESEVFHLINCAPNLKAVNGLCWLSEVRNSACERLHIFTGICVYPFEELDLMFKSLVQAKPKLEELQILDLELRPIPQLWSTPLRQLLKQSTCTLRSLSICAIQLLKVRRKTFTLRVLEYLKLFLPEALTLEEVQNIVAGLGLQELCPRLMSLRLCFGQECSHRVSSRLRTNDSGSVTPIWSVRKVTTEMALCTSAIVQSCISAFPLMSVFAFEVLRCAEVCQSTSDEHFYEVHRIWTDISTIEELKLCLVGSEVAPRHFSLDALFCGLSTDEARFLRPICKTDERNIQLCPARPSVLYGQSLKEVTVVFSPNYTYKHFCISELSGILAFDRLPSLRLKLESHCPAVSSEVCCLAGFAEIITVTDKRNWW